MNNDPTAASDTARLPTHDDNDSDTGSQDEADAAEGSSQQSQSQTSRRSRNGCRRSSSRVRRAKAGIAKKLEFLTHLMSSLDVVVFAELCVLYYMEYALFLFPLYLAARDRVRLLTPCCPPKAAPSPASSSGPSSSTCI